MRIGVKSIAADLGISHMTVSRALSGHPNVSAKTRALVLARAAELDYVPSAAARVMRGEKTRIVGLLLPNLTNAFYASFADALARFCGEAGFHLNINLTNDNSTEELAAVKRLRELDAFALVMVPTGDIDPNLENLFGDTEIVQLVRRSPMSRPATYLGIDERPALLAAVARLVAAGHKRIGYIGADAGLSSGAARLAAFKEGIVVAHGDPEATLVHVGHPSFETGIAGVNFMMAGDAAPTALVTGGFEISNGALEACLDDNLDIPKQLAFVGFGDSSFYRWVKGGITTIGLPVEAMAMAAVAHLSAVASGETPDDLSPHLAQLVVRRSV